MRAYIILPVLVILLTIGAFVVSMALLASGRVKPELNLNIDFEFAEAYMQFSAGTSDAKKEAFLRQMEQAVADTNEEFGGNVVVTQARQLNWARLERQSRSGSQYAALWVELVSPDKRDVTLNEFSASWQAKIQNNPNVETLQFEAGEDSYPDLQLYFSGADIATLKATGKRRYAGN